MGALDCVTSSKMQPTESTEVFAINMSSNSTLNEPRRDLESQATGSRKHSRLWTLFVDLPLVLIVLVVVGLFELGVIPSYQSGFFCNDPALSFPFTGDTVSSGVLVATIFIAPLIVISGTELIFCDLQYSFWEKTKTVTKKTLLIYRNYIYGLIFNFALVEVMKGITGSPRPTFLYLCEPDANCTGSDRYISSFQCTSTKFSRWMQKDSYHSFPSGHTSLSVHCALFISWYLQRRAFDWRSRTVFVVPTVQLAAITFAAVSSLTRITDHRHHWWDVAVGFFVGLATFFYAAIVLSKREAVISRSSSASRVQQSVKTLIFDPKTIEPVSP